MDYTTRCRRISNRFYNRGLEKARIRDLTGAVECLKKSVHFNKYNTDARNLLGLIYYEVGETAEALVQWVISCNLQPEKNRAMYYLHEIQDKPGRLEAESANIKKYNQGLFHAQNGSDDLAILQLSRVVERNPHFLKAHMVLALLYIAREDYTKAGKSLYKVLQIDKHNPRALWYMSIVKANTGRAEVEKKKLNNAFSHRQMQDDDVIIPSTYRENTGWQTIINIIVGLILGASVIFVLVMPTVKESLNHQHNQELISVLDQVSQKNLEITGLQDTIAVLEAEKKLAETDLENIDEANQEQIRQYRILVEIMQAYQNDDFTQAVQLYAEWQPELIADEAMQVLVTEIRDDMEANGYQVLAKLGDEAGEAGDTVRALDYYEKSLAIKEDNPQVLLDMAAVYKTVGEEEKAKELWGRLIMEYPDTSQAATAKEERGY